MKETDRSAAEPSQKGFTPLDGICIALVALGLFMFIPSFMFSLGPLVATRGQAWEYDPVRELFIVSVVTFVLVVALPLVVRYGLARGRKWAKASAVGVGVASLLVGALFLLSALSTGVTGGLLFIPALFLVLGASIFWLLHRKRAV